MLATRQQQSIDEPLSCDQRTLNSFQLRTDKPVIKAGIVDHQRCVANEGKEFIRNFHETFVLLQKFGRKSVDCEGLGRHIAVGIEIDVKSRSGRDPIQ